MELDAVRQSAVDEVMEKRFICRRRVVGLAACHMSTAYIGGAYHVVVDTVQSGAVHGC